MRARTSAVPGSRDAVNLGSRVEGLNNAYATVLLAAKTTVAAAGDRFLFRELNRGRVKGKETPVALYELLARRPAPPAAVDRAERFAAALEAYRRRAFTAAEERFAALAEQGDGAAAVFVERCCRYRAEPPPEDWDGVETFETK